MGRHLEFAGGDEMMISIDIPNSEVIHQKVGHGKSTPVILGMFLMLRPRFRRFCCFYSSADVTLFAVFAASDRKDEGAQHNSDDSNSDDDNTE